MLSYAITDPTILSFDNLISDIERIAKKADMILYRDKQTDRYEKNAKAFVKAAKSSGFEKILLHNEIDLALVLGADGVHLSSEHFDQIAVAKSKGLFTIISTHSLEEVKKAQQLGADMVTFSPIYATPGKGKPVGVKKLAEITDAVNIPVIALGGILTYEQIKACEDAGAAGFASIRYFREGQV